MKKIKNLSSRNLKKRAMRVKKDKNYEKNNFLSNSIITPI